MLRKLRFHRIQLLIGGSVLLVAGIFTVLSPLVSLGDNAVTDGQSPTTLSFELHSTDGTEAGLYTLT